MITNKIELNSVSKTFGTKQVLSKVSLLIKPNERWAIVGRSGEGKSVLLRIMIGLTPADSGDIQIDGVKVLPLNTKSGITIAQKIGFVFQQAALFDSMTVLENITIRLAEENTYDESMRYQIALRLLAEVGLDSSIIHRYPAELSGGMRKRVGIARAIAHQPNLLLCDEPTSGLDPVTAKAIDTLILELSQKQKLTTILVTHFIQSIRTVATHVAHLYQGKFIFCGNTSDYWGHPHPEIQQFVQHSY
ncbi:MAG: ATP-binding cassette domain-containing protein [Bacteroidia bacterium]|nr:ATP-binding cassette domain-containing protein [Bacteroidia bacterium]